LQVVRLQTALNAATKTVDDDRAARRDSENRVRAATEALAQVGARLERDEQRRRTDDQTTKNLLAAVQDAEAAALAARQDAVKRVEEHSTRWDFCRPKQCVGALFAMATYLSVCLSR